MTKIYVSTRKLLFAVTLIPSNTPLDKRIEILNRYLEPPSIKSLEIDRGISKFPKFTEMGKISGSVRVSPPKGTCFTVTTDRDRRDIEVCKPTSIKWFLEDLDQELATITWTIRTGQNDFGTPITWKTPYTVARIMTPDMEFYKANSIATYFKSCVPSLGDNTGNQRKITLTHFNGVKWNIRFPDKDEELKLTPEVPPAPPPQENKDPHGGNEGHGSEHGEAPPPKPIEPAEKMPPPEDWTINTGRAFVMSVGNFITDGSMPPGKKGECRYLYDYRPFDFSHGRIECHHTDQFLYFYAFLPCMKPIIPRN